MCARYGCAQRSELTTEVYICIYTCAVTKDKANIVACNLLLTAATTTTTTTVTADSKYIYTAATTATATVSNNYIDGENTAKIAQSTPL